MECPCTFRSADPIFPGSEGSRWDCEYINNGLNDIPTQCWDLHPNVTQVSVTTSALGHR